MGETAHSVKDGLKGREVEASELLGYSEEGVEVSSF